MAIMVKRGNMRDLRRLSADSSIGDGASASRKAVRFLDRRLIDQEEPPLGAHIISPRRGYLHHGIYVGDGLVVHYAGLAYGFYRGSVEEVPLAQFARGRGIWARWRQPAFDREAVVRRARSRVGEARYRILHNNCEHFCEWCVHGEPRSYQVERLISAGRALAGLLWWITRWGAFCGWMRPNRTRRSAPNPKELTI